jgi:hypothetical protein
MNLKKRIPYLRESRALLTHSALIVSRALIHPALDETENGGVDVVVSGNHVLSDRLTESAAVGRRPPRRSVAKTSQA